MSPALRLDSCHDDRTTSRSIPSRSAMPSSSISRGRVIPWHHRSTVVWAHPSTVRRRLRLQSRSTRVDESRDAIVSAGTGHRSEIADDREAQAARDQDATARVGTTEDHDEDAHGVPFRVITETVTTATFCDTDSVMSSFLFAIEKRPVYHYRMKSAFGSFLRGKIKENDPSYKRIAEILGTNNAEAYRVIEGSKAPSPKMLEQWSERLRLTPDDRAEMWMLALSAKAPDDIKTLCHELISLYRDVLRLKDERARTDLKLRAHLSPVAGRRVAEGPLDPDDWIDYGATLYDPEPPGASPAPGRSAAAPKRDDENGEA